MLWCITNDMVEGAASVVLYGFGGLARNAPIATMALSLGPLLIPALLALWPPAKLPRHAWPSVAGMILGFLVFYLVRISRDAPYIGFRAGQFLQLALPGLAAVFFARLAQRSRAMAAIAATLLIAIGLPTTLIDDFNAQDIGNREMGPGFRWTIMLTPGRAGGVPVVAHPDAAESDCRNGSGRAWKRNMEPAPDIRLAPHGGCEADLADGGA